MSFPRAFRFRRRDESAQGKRTLAVTPNTETLIGLDFSLQDVFPPDPSKGDRVPLKK